YTGPHPPGIDPAELPAPGRDAFTGLGCLMWLDDQHDLVLRQTYDGGFDPTDPPQPPEYGGLDPDAEWAFRAVEHALRNITTARPLPGPLSGRAPAFPGDSRGGVRPGQGYPGRACYGGNPCTTPKRSPSTPRQSRCGCASPATSTPRSAMPSVSACTTRSAARVRRTSWSTPRSAMPSVSACTTRSAARVRRTSCPPSAGSWPPN